MDLRADWRALFVRLFLRLFFVLIVERVGGGLPVDLLLHQPPARLVLRLFSGGVSQPTTVMRRAAAVPGGGAQARGKGQSEKQRTGHHLWICEPKTYR